MNAWNENDLFGFDGFEEGDGSSMGDSEDMRLWGLLSRLQWLTSRYLMNTGRDDAAIRDVSRGQGKVLTLLKLKPEISQKDLTVLMDMRQQSLGELLSKLEKKGLVVREPSEEDRRKVIVRITDEGRAEAEKLGERPTVEFAFFDCLTDEEKANLQDYLSRMVAELESTLGDTDDGNEFESRRRERERFFDGLGAGGPDGRGRGGWPGFGGPDGRDRGGLDHDEAMEVFRSMIDGGRRGPQRRGDRGPDWGRGRRSDER